jgi:O-antigen chain-terminating methyltransferase
MTNADDAAAQERFARDRQQADRRYNEALTALDHAVTATVERDTPGRENLAQFANALILYAQQITAFVESKDREIVANADARIRGVEQAMEQIRELQSRIGVVQRALQALARPGTEHPAPTSSLQPSATGHRPPAPSTEHPPPVDYKYVAFEDQFRGSDDTIAGRLRAYVPLFIGVDNVVDLGCGRGELLAALKTAGVQARGVDANAEMAAIARERGLDAEHGDALGFLVALPDESLGGLIATQVVEHLEPAYLLRLIDTAWQKLRRGAPIVLETINVACWLGFFGSYLRDFTHVRPIHPDTLQFLLRAAGFERVEIRYSAPVPDEMKMRTVDLPIQITSANDEASRALSSIAHAVNVNAVILNNLAFTSLDYAAIGYKS